MEKEAKRDKELNPDVYYRLTGWKRYDVHATHISDITYCYVFVP